MNNNFMKTILFGMLSIIMVACTNGSTEKTTAGDVAQKDPKPLTTSSALPEAKSTENEMPTPAISYETKPPVAHEWSSESFRAAADLLSQYPSLFLNELEQDVFDWEIDSFGQLAMSQVNYAAFDLNGDGRPVIVLTEFFYEGNGNHFYTFRDGQYQEDKGFESYNIDYGFYTDRQGRIVLLEYGFYDEGIKYSYITNRDGQLEKEMMYNQTYGEDGINKLNEKTFLLQDVLVNPLLLEPSIEKFLPLPSASLSETCREIIHTATLEPQLCINGKRTPLTYPLIMDGETPLMSLKDIGKYFQFTFTETTEEILFQKEKYGTEYEVAYTQTQGWIIEDDNLVLSPVPPQIIDGMWYVPIDFTLNSLGYKAVWMASLNIEYAVSNE